jgi:signal transduction histidine kinase
VALAEAGVNAALIDVNPDGRADQADRAPSADVAQSLDACVQRLAALDEFDPAYALLLRAVERAQAALLAAPQREQWLDLRQALRRAGDELEIRRSRLAGQRDTLTLAFQRHYDAVTIESLLLAAVGLALFGSLAVWFFARLSGDIQRLEAHARQIVRGIRGVALPVHRDDELGHLMRAVNRMADDLGERERQIELDTQRRAHQDKMLSVGALAAGIAHEVNNPLAAITGAAQALRGLSAPADAQQLEQVGALILAQAERAARAARQLADVAAPEAAESDWIDLNGLLRRVVQLNGYDRRYRHFQVDTTALDAGLPAVRAAADALRHVLMQLLSAACDAMAGAACRPASLALATGGTASEVWVRMTLPVALDFTRPALQRTLTLCRAIIEPQGGRLAFDQSEGGGLRCTLFLPADTGVHGG